LEVTRELALLGTRAAEERKAGNVLLLDLKGLTLVADYFLVASGDTGRQVKAIAEHIEQTYAREGLRLLHKEGFDNARWVLLDFGGIVCHIFNKADREFYGLERLWGDAERVVTSAVPGSPAGQPGPAPSRATAAAEAGEGPAEAGVPARERRPGCED